MHTAAEPRASTSSSDRHVRRRRSAAPTNGAKLLALPTGAPAIGTLEHFALFCRTSIWVGEGKKRRRLEIEPFQMQILEGYFDGVEETLAIIPKGNGKTTLLAALALYHLCVYRDADIVVIAAARDQASELYMFAARMVRDEPMLKKRLRDLPGYKIIRARDGGGQIRSLPADVDTIDGKGPTLVFIEEFHRHKTAEPYALMAASLHKRDGQLIAITTAGDDHTSALGQARLAAYRKGVVEEDEKRVFKRVLVEGGVIEEDELDDDEIGAHDHEADEDEPEGRFLLLEWSLETVDFDGEVLILDQMDENDLDLVARANPISTITRRVLRREANSPTRVESLWKRLRCGLWAQDDDAAIPQAFIRQALAPGCEIPADADDVFLACDFGWVKDTTALIPLWKMPGSPSVLRVDRRLAIMAAPAKAGERLDEDDVKNKIREFVAIWPRLVIVLDPNAGGAEIAKWAAAELGVTVIPHSQDSSPMAQGAGIVEEHLLQGRFEHPGHDQFTRQLTAAKRVSVSSGDGRWKFGHHPSVPVDAPMALAMGARIAYIHKRKKSVAPFVLARG